MKDDKQGIYCDQCERRCRDGALQVTVFGVVSARRSASAGEGHYCGERCLRNRLMNVRGEEDPEEALQRQLDKANERTGDERHRADGAVSSLRQVESLVLDTEKLLPAIPDTEPGARLKRTLINAMRIIRDEGGRGY